MDIDTLNDEIRQNEICYKSYLDEEALIKRKKEKIMAKLDELYRKKYKVLYTIRAGQYNTSIELGLYSTYGRADALLDDLRSDSPYNYSVEKISVDSRINIDWNELNKPVD